MFSKKTRNLTVAALAFVMALTLSFGLLGFDMQASAISDYYLELTNATNTGNEYEWTFSELKTKNYVTYVELPFMGSGTVAWKCRSNQGTRFLYLSHNENGSWVEDSSRSIEMTKSYVSIDFAEEDIYAANGKYYLVFTTSDDFKGTGVKVNITPAAQTFQVTYNYNDGETENFVEEWTQGDVAITLEEPTRTDYTFLGWNDGTTTYAAGAEYTPTANVTLTAQWSYNFVNVTVDGVTEKVEKNTTHTLTVPTQEGKNFLGWSYANDNTPTILPANPTVNVAEADITLYTCWTVQDGLLIYNSIDNQTTETVELATNPTVSDYETLFGAVEDIFTFEKWVDENGIEYALNQAVTSATTVQLFPVFKVASYEYPALEVWVGETFDIATLPAKYNGFDVTWTADATVTDKYVGTLTAKGYYNVTETVLTQNLSRFNYTVVEAYDFGTLIALGVDGVNAVLPKTVKLTGSYTTADGDVLTKDQEFALSWNLASITESGTYQLTATVAPVVGFEVTGNVTATVNVQNAKVVEYVFDFANNAALTADEWATIPDFSGTNVNGAHTSPLEGNGTTYTTYLNLNKTGASLTYTLPTKAYVTEIKVVYAAGTKETANLVVTTNYVDGTNNVTSMPANGNWVVCEGTATLDSKTQVTSIVFTSSNQDKFMAIKSIKVTYVSLLTDSVMTLDVNGGDELPQTTFTIKGGNSFTLPTATRAATADAVYNLTGWLCNEKLYAVGEELIPEANMTFVAQWDVIALNTPVTGVTLANNQTEVVVNGAVNYPTTVTATYGEGKTVELNLTLADGQTLVDTANIGVYTLTYNVDNMNGFYDLGEFGTVTFTVTVYEWKVSNVETVNLTVKQGATLNTPATVTAYVQKWNGTAFYSEVEPKAFAVTWEAFDTTQEIRPGYTIVGTLTTENGYNFGEFTTVTANVEINNFEYSAVRSVWFIDKESYNQLETYGYTKGGTTRFDESKDDEYWGFKLENGGYIQFTLDKEARVVIGLSGLATKTNVKFQFGLVNDTTGELTELYAISTFEQEQYQVIDQVLQAGTYKLVNNNTESKSMNVNVRYIQILDGGQEFFIPSTGNDTAPANTDKANFLGWTDGTTLYTAGARMPVATTNKGTVAYEPFYGDPASFGTVLNYTLLGYYQESTLTLVSAIDTTVATAYTAINAKATWTDGAALRIAGASKEAADDNSALKFVLNLEFNSNVARLVNNLENNNLTFGLENAGEAQYTLVKTVADDKNLTVSLYVEKVASLGLIDTAIAPKVSLNGSEYVTANAYTAKFIAGKALADAQAELLGDYEFMLSDGTYSRFNETERTELQKYIDLAPATGGDDSGNQGGDSGEQGGNSSEQGSESTGGTSTGSDEPTTSSDDETNTTGSDTPTTGETSTDSDEPTTSSDNPTTGSDSGWSDYH